MCAVTAAVAAMMAAVPAQVGEILTSIEPIAIVAIGISLTLALIGIVKAVVR